MLYTLAYCSHYTFLNEYKLQIIFIPAGCFRRKRRGIVIALAASSAAAASCETLTFSNISVITEEIYLKLNNSCSLTKGGALPVGEVIHQFF